MDENDGLEQADKIQAAAGDSVAVHTMSRAELSQAIGEGRVLAGHMISVAELEQAMREGRVLGTHYWSSMGDGSFSLYIASGIHFLSDGRVPEEYLVFPGAVSPEMLEFINRQWDEWDESYQVFRDFGVTGECSLSRYERELIADRVRAEQEPPARPPEHPLKELAAMRKPLKERARNGSLDKEMVAALLSLATLPRSTLHLASTLQNDYERPLLKIWMSTPWPPSTLGEVRDHLEKAAEHIAAAAKALLR